MRAYTIGPSNRSRPRRDLSEEQNRSEPQAVKFETRLSIFRLLKFLVASSSMLPIRPFHFPEALPSGWYLDETPLPLINCFGPASIRLAKWKRNKAYMEREAEEVSDARRCST
jgi:hypothetical protein